MNRPVQSQTSEGHIPKSIPVSPSAPTSILTRQRNLSVSHFDVRQSAKRHSSSSIGNPVNAEKISRHSLDSAAITPLRRSMLRSSANPASPTRLSGGPASPNLGPPSRPLS